MKKVERFRDRPAAGRLLAGRLKQYAGRRDVLVLALPRGGVPVAREIAAALRVPLDVYTVRKLGVPGREELAMGAIAADGTCVVDPGTIRTLAIGRESFDAVVRRETQELRRREAAYRAELPAPAIAGKVVIVVDDGMATGSTMYAAVQALRERQAAFIIVAVPVAPAATCAELRTIADAVLCPLLPSPFLSVGSYYEDFNQVDDRTVRDLLERARKDIQPWSAA